MLRPDPPLTRAVITQLIGLGGRAMPKLYTESRRVGTTATLPLITPAPSASCFNCAHRHSFCSNLDYSYSIRTATAHRLLSGARLFLSRVLRAQRNHPSASTRSTMQLPPVLQASSRRHGEPRPNPTGAYASHIPSRLVRSWPSALLLRPDVQLCLIMLILLPTDHVDISHDPRVFLLCYSPHIGNSFEGPAIRSPVSRIFLR